MGPMVSIINDLSHAYYYYPEKKENLDNFSLEIVIIFRSTIFASNTSSLSITEIASMTGLEDCTSSTLCQS